MCTLNLLCVLISMVDKCKNFNAGQKFFPNGIYESDEEEND